MLFQYPVEEAEILVAAFEDGNLDKDDWSHEAHLLAGMKMCLLYQENAYLEMKKRVISFNEAVGTTNSDSSGYHETITMYWIWEIFNFCKKNNITRFDQYAVDTLLMSEEMAERNTFLQYYQKETIISTAARRNILESDLKKMDNVAFFYTSKA
jgi:hypothetical protein